MKSGIFFSLLLCLTLLSGCATSPATGGENTFDAVIVELSDSSALVEPDEGTDERKSSDRISFSTEGLDDIGVSVGSRVSITYTGGIMESYPTQIRAVSWTLVDSGKNTAAVQKAKERTQTENTEETTAITYPPQLIFGTDENSYKLDSSGGNWSYKNKFGRWQGLSLDMPHPLDDNRTLGAISYNEDYIISFDCDVQPEILSVRCWDNGTINPDDIYSALPEDIHMDNNKFVPKNNGEYIYELIAQWPDNGQAYNGTGYYIFVVMSDYTKFSAQYINQTINQSAFDGTDITTIIKTKDELENYSLKYKDLFYFTHRVASTETDGATIGLLDAFDKYNEEYFNNKSLIITAFKEPSISKIHEVSGIYDNGVIFINRYSQPTEGQIIQSWHIIIEVDKDYPPLVSEIPLKIAFMNIYKLPKTLSEISQ